MIKYVKSSSIDRFKYDQCIKLDKSGLIYGLSSYLDLVCESWDALVLNDYDAVWPLPIREKFGVKYFFRPFGIQQLGIFSKLDISDFSLSNFITELQNNCSFADVFLNEGQQIEEGFKKMKFTDNSNCVLFMNSSYEDIYGTYSKNTKRNIKKAASSKWQVMEHDSPDQLINLFQENKGKDLSIAEEFYKNMKKIMYSGIHNNWGKLWTVYSDRNELCAGIFMIEYRDRSIMLFSGNSEEGRKKGALYHLLNEYIILNSNKIQLLDFEGSNNEGLSRFYKGFGAEQRSYLNLKYNGLPLLLKWLK